MQPIDKPLVIGRLDALRGALQQETASAMVTQALHQCERLHQAVLQSHAEGLRFASFTLTRLMQQQGTGLSETTRARARDLKEGLDAAGYGA